MKKTSFDGYQDSTPLGAATCRVLEAQHEPASERLFNDSYVLNLLPASPGRPGVRAMQWLLEHFSSVLERMIKARAGGGSFLIWLGGCRTRLIDDVLERLMIDGAKQVVLLGAGYDARAIRLAREGVTFFEVDRPQVQEQKKESLARMPDAAHGKMVSVDFTTQKLQDRLFAEGFQAELKSVFVMEGVSQYIPREGLIDTLSMVGGLTDAAIAFTYVHQDVFDNPAALQEDMPLSAIEEVLEKTKTASEPWITGYRPSQLPDLLASVGLKLTSDEGWLECRERYLLPKGRDLIPLKLERLVTAVQGAR